MGKNGFILVIITKVMHLMVIGKGKEPINIGMDKFMKEHGQIVYVMVMVKIDIQMAMFT